MKSERKIDRLDKYMSIKGLNDNKLTIDLGLSVGTIGKSRAIGRDLSSRVVEKILNFYQDIDSVWLMTGEGKMLKEKTTNVTKIEGQIPIYDIRSIFSNRSLPAKYISLPDLPNADGAFYMRGDNMEPDIKGGDVVVYKNIRSVAGIYYGQIYILCIDLDGDVSIEVQYIDRAKDDDNVSLVSSNKHYPSRDIPLSAIKSLAIVKASVRYYTMV